MSEEAKSREGVGEFIKKTRAELDKTTFPSANDVKGTTIIVIISVLFFAAYLFGIDRLWWVLIATKDGPAALGGQGILVWVINKIAGA